MPFHSRAIASAISKCSHASRCKPPAGYAKPRPSLELQVPKWLWLDRWISSVCQLEDVGN
jgi:hypothetical protein